MSFSGTELEQVLLHLDMTEGSITNASIWLARWEETEEAATCVKVWASVFARNPDRRLNLLYLANDVVQNSKFKRHGRFARVFLPELVTALRECALDEVSFLPKVERMVTKIWEKRNIFSRVELDQLKAALKTNPEPSVKIPEYTKEELDESFRGELLSTDDEEDEEGGDNAAGETNQEIAARIISKAELTLENEDELDPQVADFLVNCDVADSAGIADELSVEKVQALEEKLSAFEKEEGWEKKNDENEKDGDGKTKSGEQGLIGDPKTKNNDNGENSNRSRRLTAHSSSQSLDQSLYETYKVDETVQLTFKHAKQLINTCIQRMNAAKSRDLSEKITDMIVLSSEAVGQISEKQDENSTSRKRLRKIAQELHRLVVKRRKLAVETAKVLAEREASLREKERKERLKKLSKPQNAASAFLASLKSAPAPSSTTTGSPGPVNPSKFSALSAALGGGGGGGGSNSNKSLSAAPPASSSSSSYPPSNPGGPGGMGRGRAQTTPAWAQDHRYAPYQQGQQQPPPPYQPPPPTYQYQPPPPTSYPPHQQHYPHNQQPHWQPPPQPGVQPPPTSAPPPPHQQHQQQPLPQGGRGRGMTRPAWMQNQ